MISSRLSPTYVVGIIVLSMLSGILVMPSDGKNGSFGGGDGTAANPYLIEDVWDLQNMSSDLDACYALMCDINASSTSSWNSGEGFQPVGNLTVPFIGSLDGRDHVISGLHINRRLSPSIGLFGHIGGTVMALRLTDCHILGDWLVAGLGGSNSGSLSGCYMTGKVRGDQYIGGLVGRNSGTVTNCHATSDVNGRQAIGGLVGWNSGMVLDCTASGNVSGDNTVGGLAGASNSDISNCHAFSNVSGEEDIGGLIGYIDCRVKRCYTMGNVTGTLDVGGLVGFSSLDNVVSECHALGNVTGGDNVGGLVGESFGKVNCSYAAGNASGNTSVGGLAGKNWGTVVENYAMGSVSGKDKVGGLVGWNVDGNVIMCHSTGNVRGTKNIGGLVGNSDSGRVSRSFWDTETSDQSSSAGGTGRTTSQMKVRNTFEDAGWDFMNVWCIIDEVTYPLLRWQDQEPPLALAGPDESVDEGSVVVFDASGSRDDLGIVNISWVFTDGVIQTLYGARPSYLFDNPGVFLVTLVVKDLLDRIGTDTTSVIVRDITRPVAVAGQNQSVNEGTIVMFDGSGSSDNVGIVDHKWSFRDGSLVTLSGVRPSYRFKNPGEFTVTLNVSDAAGNWDTDTFLITVIDRTPPVADAGLDQTVDEGALVLFVGSGSRDNAGIVNWTWTFQYGVLFPEDKPCRLYGEICNFTFSTPGIHLVRLTVRDAAGHEHSDHMNVTVRDIIPPSVDAGLDLAVDEGMPVRFDGSSCADSGGIANYTWGFEYGMMETYLYGQNPTFTFGVPGRYPVTLKVTDHAGHWSTDTVNVTVNDIAPPVADAGPDQTVNEGDLITLDGSGSFDTAGITNYTWLISYGNETVELYGASVPFTSTVPDVYTVVLRVSDAAGHTDEDAMTLTITDITAPVADAGADRAIPVGNVVSLDGSLSRDNVGIVNYTWTVTYNGLAHTITGAAVQFTFDKGGVHEVILTVADAAGNLDNDTVVITVVDTGRVTGTVLDEDGRPVKDATVVVTASNGKICTAMTVTNGSFALDVFHGDFTWRISKKGYKASSGSSSVAPMEGTELDLSDKPLVKEDGAGPFSVLFLVLAVVLVLIVVRALSGRGRRG